jgi:hypothetical protein
VSQVYYVEYDGYYAMSWHDKEENALKRWFDNYKVERYASFASECEWLVVKEVDCDSKSRKKRLICEIGDDGRGTKREVIMDHTTPPAPMLTFAAKRRWEPPPPKSPAEQRREMEWQMMMARGYEPVRRARRRAPILMGWDLASGPDFSATVEIEYDIEWVRRPQRYFDEPVRAYTPPPPPRHRRNA